MAQLCTSYCPTLGYSICISFTKYKNIEIEYVGGYIPRIGTLS